MPRYVTKGGMIKCHAYQFLDNGKCEIDNLIHRNPGSVKIVGYTDEPRTISIVVDKCDDTIVIPQYYYLVFYEDGEMSIMSPEIFTAHYEYNNPYLKGP